jgi:hypothetical protein
MSLRNQCFLTFQLKINVLFFIALLNMTQIKWIPRYLKEISIDYPPPRTKLQRIASALLLPCATGLLNAATPDTEEPAWGAHKWMRPLLGFLLVTIRHDAEWHVCFLSLSYLSHFPVCRDWTPHRAREIECGDKVPVCVSVCATVLACLLIPKVSACLIISNLLLKLASPQTCQLVE